MKFTIITVCYNSEKYIRYAIESVLNQTYKNIEYIIVDGKSSDSTINIIKNYEFLLEGRMRWISEKDNGIYDAMNKGILLATGDIIGILNSDDFYLHDNVLKEVCKCFVENKCDSVYGDLVYVDSIDTTMIKRYWKSGDFNKKSFKSGWMPPHPAFFVKREIYLKYGLFNLQLKSAADYEFMLRVLHKEQISTFYYTEILVKMRVGGKSNISLRNRLNANKEDRLAWSINKLEPYFFTLYLKPLRKIFQYFYKPNPSRLNS